MAHRYPVHVSDKWHNAIAEKFPGASDILAAQREAYLPAGADAASYPPWLGVGAAQLNLAMAYTDVFDGELRAYYASLNGRRVDDSLLEQLATLEHMAFNAALQGMLPTAEEIVLMGEWERSRQVLRFDPDFARAVVDSSGALPVSPAVLDKLPYDVFFVERRSTVCPASWHKLPDGSVEVEPDAEAAGFFVYRTSMSLDPDDPFDLEGQLCIIWVDQSGRRICHEVLSTERSSIGEMIDESDSYMDSVVDDMRRKQVMRLPDEEERAAVNASLMPARRRRVEEAMSLVLYLCSMEPEYSQASPGGEPKARRKRGAGSGLTGNTPVVVVGARIGEAIRAYEGASGRDGEGEDGPKVRPHVRRGHFHRHWRGSGEKRELVVMWHAPTFVNAEFGTVQAVTTVHEVKRNNC